MIGLRWRAAWHRAIPAPIAGVLLLLSAAAAVAAPGGSVIGLSGTSYVESGAARHPLKLGEAVQIGDTVEVSAGARLKLRMTDGSVISLASATRMTVGSYEVDTSGRRKEAKLSLGLGLLRAVVTRGGGPGTFEVQTAVGTSGVRSTDWFVETQPGWVQVAVLTGSVALTSAATGAVTTVPARWGAKLDTSHEPATARRWTAAEFGRLIARTELPQRRRPRRSGLPPAGQATAAPAPYPSEAVPGYGSPPGVGSVPPPTGAYAPPPFGYPPPSPPRAGYGPPPGFGYGPPSGGYRPPTGGRGFPSGGYSR